MREALTVRGVVSASLRISIRVCTSSHAPPQGFSHRSLLIQRISPPVPLPLPYVILAVQKSFHSGRQKLRRLDWPQDTATRRSQNVELSLGRAIFQ